MQLDAVRNIPFSNSTVRGVRAMASWMRPDPVRNARPPAPIITHGRSERERAQFELVQQNIRKQREEYKRTQPHGLTPSSRWSSYSGKPLPAGTQLSPTLQAKLSAGQGVIARWSPEQQLWINAI